MKKFFILTFFLVLIKNVVYANLDILTTDKYSSLSTLNNEKLLKFENDLFFGVKINMLPGWKTYWKNPGDSGETISLKFFDNKNIIKHEILYPPPNRYFDSDIETIGYENEVIFPIRLNLRDTNQNFRTDVNINYLVCKHICIPVNEKRVINYNPRNISENNKSILAVAINQNPIKQDSFFDIHQIDIGKKKIKIKINDFNNKNSELDIFTFSENYEFDYKIIPEGKFNSQILLVSNSKFELKDKLEVLVVNKTSGNSNIFNINIGNKKNHQSIIFMSMIAFIGGVILNFMPCVLPVLSLKIYSLINLNKDDKSKILFSSLATAAGILFSFILLGIVIILLRTLGNEVGWGIQFQSSEFLLIFSLILFFFSLNLIGVFEIFMPSIFNKLNNVDFKNKYISAFFTGIISTALATPCSAPFLGTAISFAFTQNDLYTIFIFTALGLGFGIPYFLIMVAPSALNIFPKPGLWMIKMKYILGMLVLLTALWLLSLMKFNLTVLYLIFILFGGLGFYISKLQLSKNILSILLLLISSFVIFPKKEQNDEMWLKYEKNILQDMIEKNNIVFVDVTADWCVTCKINKISTLDKKEMKSFFTENNVKLLKADWTNKNIEIQNYMKSFNKYGIPLNIVYGPKNKDGIVLGELLSKKKIIEAINEVKQ